MSEQPRRRRVVRSPLDYDQPRVPPNTRNVALALAEQTLRAKAELEKRGLYLAHRPADESPVLPSDPTALSDSGLMRIFARFTGWADYLGGQVALAEVDERVLDAVADKAETVSLLRAMPSSEALRKREDTMTRVKAEVSQDPDVVRCREAHAEAYARRKLLTIMFERADRDSALLSRELTRRTAGQDAKQRRSARYTP